jgi:NADH dehydrogenase
MTMIESTEQKVRRGGARPRIVVVGGGFAGLHVVRGLRRARVEVTLVDRQNFSLFQPLVYQVATGALSAAEVAAPLRSVFKRQRNARVVLAEATGFDLERRRVMLGRLANGRPARALAYDTLVVAGGSQYSYFGHPEWAAHAPQLKSLDGALDVRSRVLGAFEAAEVEPDPTGAGPGSRSWSSGRGRPASRWPARSRSSPATRCGATSAAPIRAPRGCSWSRPGAGCWPNFPSRCRSGRGARS